MTPVYYVCWQVIRQFHGICYPGVISGLEHIPKTGPLILASNHASALDPPLVGSPVERQIHFFARKTLWKKGLPSWWLDAVGAIPIDREGESDISAFKRVFRCFEQGGCVLFFPEGTRTCDGRLQAARPGMGMIACKSGVPVVPARLFGVYEAYSRHNRFPGLFRPVDIVYGRPLVKAEYDPGKIGKDRYQLAADRIMEAIASLERPRETIL